MSIGGNSFNNGVNFVSDDYAAKFIMQKDGSHKIITEKRIMTGGIRKRAKKIPILKGLVSMFSGSRLIVLIFAVSVIDDVLRHATKFNAPSAYLTGEVAIAAVTVVCFAYVLKKLIFRAHDTWAYHGAEHKTIYAYEHGMELTLENVRACPRVAKRCGTNFLVFFILFFLALAFLLDYSSLIFLLSYVLGYELFDISDGEKLPVLKPFFKLGNWCQQHIFTREPTDAQILASIDAMKSLIELQNGAKPR